MAKSLALEGLTLWYGKQIVDSRTFNCSISRQTIVNTSDPAFKLFTIDHIEKVNRGLRILFTSGSNMKIFFRCA